MYGGHRQLYINWNFFLCSLHDFSERFIISHIIWKQIGYSKSFMITISHTYLFISKNELLWVPVQPSRVFSQEKTSSIPSFSFRMRTFTELFANIKKYGKNDIEWQISIQGMNWSGFWDYLRKRDGSFNMWTGLIIEVMFCDMITRQWLLSASSWLVMDGVTCHGWLVWWISGYAWLLT